MHRFPSPRGTPVGRRRIRRAALVAGATGLGFGGLYLTGLLVTGDDIPAGTRVNGVDVGGLDRSQAQQKLNSQIGEAWESVKVRIGDRTDTLDGRAAGFSLDSEETAARAARSGIDPLTVIGSLFTDEARDVEPVVRVDEAKARAALAATEENHTRKPRDGAIGFDDGEPVPRQPQSGRSLDVDRALAKLRSAGPGEGDGPIRLPVRRTEARVDAAELSRAMKEFAEPAMSAPVTLTTGGRQIEVAPDTIGEHLTMKPDKTGRLTPRLDGAGLRDDPEMARALARVTDEAVEAEPRLDGERVVISGGTSGHVATSEGIEKAILPLLTKSGPDRTGAMATEEVQPDVTREEIERLGLKEKMSSFTVEFEPAAYRTTNVGRAAEKIDGSIVRPGETWSFNDTVGERTKANGFVDGTIILNGQYTKAAGGGVSAVATTVFNAMFFAGVDPVEYGAHSFYIERYPEGREATVAWGSLDLKFNNDSGNGLYIQASATDTSVTITFLGDKKYDSVESVTGPRTNVTKPGRLPGAEKNCEPQEPLEGFDVEVDRVFRSGGEEVKRETFETHYAPRDRVTCD